MSKMDDVLLTPSLQQDVLLWFEEVILPQSSADGSFDKFLDELAELKDARRVQSEVEILHSQADRLVAEEAADVMISFLAWCHAAGVPLRQAVQDKHKINRGRTWGPPDERGVRRHVG